MSYVERGRLRSTIQREAPDLFAGDIRFVAQKSQTDDVLFLLFFFLRKRKRKMNFTGCILWLAYSCATKKKESFSHFCWMNFPFPSFSSKFQHQRSYVQQTHPTQKKICTEESSNHNKLDFKFCLEAWVPGKIISQIKLGSDTHLLTNKLLEKCGSLFFLFFFMHGIYDISFRSPNLSGNG